MFHLEQGWWLGVKSCKARAIYTNAEGRKGEVDISVCLAGVQANPWCVCFYLCADWWNELGVWEIDSGWGWSSSRPFLACLLVGFRCALLSPLPPPFLFTGWFLSLAFSHWRWRLIPKCGEKTTQTVLFSQSSSFGLDFSWHRWSIISVFLFSVLFDLLAKSSILFENLCNLLVKYLMKPSLCCKQVVVSVQFMWVTDWLPLCFLSFLRFKLTIVLFPNSSPLFIFQRQRETDFHLKFDLH